MAIVAPCLNTTWRRNNESHHTFDDSSLRNKLLFTCEVKTTMSRHLVSNHQELTLITSLGFTNTENALHRVLIVIELAPAGWLKRYAESQKIICVSSDTGTDQSDRITALLGSEHHILAYEITDPMDASLLAALAGTVTFSGVLILAVPFALSRAGLTASVKNNSHLIKQQSPARCRFTHRFIRQIEAAENNHPSNIVIASYQPPPFNNNNNEEEAHGALNRSLTTAHDRAPDLALSLAREEQDLLFRSARAALALDQSVCISIVGKRGRGKSALTARIANCLNDAKTPYRITAVHGSALSTFHKMTNHTSADYFVPTQRLGQCVIDTLLVDEASNISLALLRDLMTRCKRLILCTTVEGYESSGRAFELRLKQPIKHNFESHLELRPTQPWRWLVDDPIESVISSLVLNESENIVQPTYQPSSRSDDVNAAAKLQNSFTIRQITQQDLLNNEQELQRIFTLLRNTHYQTTVKDLQHLLDGKELFIWVLEDLDSQCLLGVLVLTLERGIEHSLHTAILQKQRRLPHHLLAQLLTQTANSTDHLSCSFARVVRISVAREARRQGIGSKLLAHVENELIAEGSSPITAKAIGASFANDTTSSEFWRSNGYTTFHNGFRKNPRTGEQAIAVLKSKDAIVSQVLQSASMILSG